MKFFQVLFAFYALLVFVFSLIVVFPFYVFVFLVFDAKKAPRIAHAGSRLWAGFLFTMFLVRYEIKNKELIDKNKVYVFAGNHRSLLDIPLFALSCKNAFRFLSKAELTKIPLLGFVIKKLYITVNRSSKADRHRSIDAMKESLDEGISVFLCPEGTRNKTANPLLEFKDGAFRLAITTKTPLAVITVYNTDKLHSPHVAYLLKPGKVYAEWCAVIDTSEMTEEDLPALKEKVAGLMTSVLKKKSL